jgi:hypothetical protein
MDKFKIVWRQVVVWLKKNWLIAGGVAVFIILLMLFMPVFRSSWMYYPESLRAKIALQKIINISAKDYYCRETCQSNLRLYGQFIRQSLLSDNKEIQGDLEKAILNPRLLAENRRLLISLWQETKVPPSDVLVDFSKDKEKDFFIRSQILAAWPDLEKEAFATETISKFKMAKDDASKLVFLDLLSGQSSESVINSLWEIILGNYSVAVKEKAFFLLANLDDKEDLYVLADVTNLRAILESADFPHRLKDQAILALGDYYSFYPIETEQLLVDIFNRPQYFDNYQRSFVLDILNNNRSLKIASLNVSAAEWEDYFNN